MHSSVYKIIFKATYQFGNFRNDVLLFVIDIDIFIDVVILKI